jgi:hypothetical protein
MLPDWVSAVVAVVENSWPCIAAWGTARSMAQSVEQKTVATIMERALKEGAELDDELTRSGGGGSHSGIARQSIRR